MSWKGDMKIAYCGSHIIPFAVSTKIPKKGHTQLIYLFPPIIISPGALADKPIIKAST